MKNNRILAAFGLAAAAASLSACSDAPTAKRTLEKAGYTDIQTTGHKFFTCGEDDTFSTGFRAKNPRGDTVEGAVCSGLLFKGATIRF